MDKYAVIVAAGAGIRMGETIPKQFLLINNKPVLYYTLRAFLNAFADIHIILVLPAEHIEKGREIIDAYFDGDKINVTAGGGTRFQSVKNGLQLIGDDSIVFVHDGVRCLLTENLIHRCYAEAVNSGTAIPAIASKDSVRIVNEESNDAIDRDKVMLVQTPQTFHSKILLPAFQIDYKEKFTDEASVVEAYGLKVTLVEGEENNIKITTKADLLIAEKILNERNN